MLRAKNEEEFLRVAATSIVDAVDEIVLVDNQSSDRTADIAAELAREFPGKVVCFSYPHSVSRVGAETRALLRDSGAQAVGLSAIFYNWCLARCGNPYVLKWDADMVATDELSREIEAWRSSGDHFLCFRGANIHPDRAHLAASKITDPVLLQQKLPLQDVPEWATALSYDSLEPRLFPRQGAEFRSDSGWTQRLWSPQLDWTPEGVPLTRAAQTACFLHLKLCKRNPFSNYSEDLAELIATNVAVGPRINAEYRALLSVHGLVGP